MALRKSRLASLIAAFAALSPAAASAMEKDELLKAMEAKYKDVTTLRADFVQTARNATFGDETVKGKMVVKRPAMMRWSFDSGEKEFVTDGKKMWIYNAEDKQVVEYEDVSGGSSAQSLLAEIDKIDEKFAVNLLQSDDTGHVVELAPKGDEQFKKVRLELAPDLMLREVAIVDTFDNVTELAFSNVTLNQPASDDLFVFSAPQGVDVIKAH